jgi:hypothetical protein
MQPSCKFSLDSGDPPDRVLFLVKLMVLLLLLQIAFSTVVYPSLLLAYLGQAAFLLNYPEHSDNPFYKSLPGK